MLLLLPHLPVLGLVLWMQGLVVRLVVVPAKPTMVVGPPRVTLVVVALPKPTLVVAHSPDRQLALLLLPAKQLEHSSSQHI